MPIIGPSAPTGIPAPAYFPFETLGAQYLTPDAFPLDPSGTAPQTEQSEPGILTWLSSLFSASVKSNAVPTSDFTIARFAEDPQKDFQISTLMQYSTSSAHCINGLLWPRVDMCMYAQT